MLSPCLCLSLILHRCHVGYAFLPKPYQNSNPKRISNELKLQQMTNTNFLIPLKASTFDLNEDINPKNTLPEKTNAPSEMEFWLDLRDTALTPQDALSYLYKELSSDYSSYGWEVITKQEEEATSVYPTVVIPDMFQRILLDDNVHLKKKKKNIFSMHNLDVIYHSSETNILQSETRLSRQESSVSSSIFGKSLPISSSSDIMMYPMTAMECLSTHQWVLLDYSKNFPSQDETERITKVSDLIQFLSLSTKNSSSGWLQSGGSGLILTSSDMENQSTTSDEIGGGGIAVVCKTRTDLLKAGVALQQYQFSTSFLSSQSISTSASGIAFVESTSRSSERCFENQPLVAMVLPFDASLWKTVAFLYGVSPSSKDEEQ